jgi:hypothetical protein
MHFQNGRIIERAAVREGDPAYDALVGFLKAPGAGWSLDLNSYAPSLFFKSEDMIINCRDDLVVANIGNGASDRMKQLVSHQAGCRTKVLEAIGRSRQAHNP